MMDSTSFFNSSLGSVPSKRKRFSSQNQPEEVVASELKDIRILASKALRSVLRSYHNVHRKHSIETLEGQMIKIVIGPPLELDEEACEAADDQESFWVHEKAICDRSPYIANCMKPEWAAHRPDPRTIVLPDDDSAAFSLYLQYLYTRKLPILPDESLGASHGGFITLAKAYVLGERLMDAEFKNAIADAFVLYARGTLDKPHFYPSNEAIRTIYEGTPEGSPIRQLLVDIWCYRGKHEWLMKDSDLPKDFMLGVMSGMLKNRKDHEHGSRPWKRNHEQYHDSEGSERPNHLPEDTASL